MTELRGAIAGVLVVDTDCRPLWADTLAAHMLERGSVLKVVGQRLRATTPVATQALRRAVAPATHHRSKTRPLQSRVLSDQAGLTVALPHPAGEPELHARVVWLSPAGEAAGTAPLVAIVLVGDPAQAARARVAQLRVRHRLTAAEVALAQILSDGHSLREAARQLDVSLNTVRTHLKRLFEKTGTNRQAALVRLVLTSAGENQPSHSNG